MEVLGLDKICTFKGMIMISASFTYDYETLDMGKKS